ncbi:MAG TPA: DMT family transporter [Rhizomicrobium sp.]|jgi:drug/metabolite transporter (DMT)-like permease|nr:DMT family transporter [Rhizomicrobium sp.]
MQHSIVPGVACGIAAGALWGAVFIAPELTPGFSALQLSAGRYLAYGVIALMLAAPRWRTITRGVKRGDWIVLAWLGLAGNIIYYIFVAHAVRLAGAAPTSFIVGLLPVVITIIGSREQGAVRLSALAPSLALAVIGVGLIAVSAMHGGAASDWHAQAVGLACAFGALASWALFAVGNARTMARLPHLSSNDWSLLLGIVSGTEALLLALPAFVLAPAHGDWTRFAAVSGGVAITASIIGNAFWNGASRRLPMTLTGQMVIFETLFALVYSFLWDRRLPHPTEVLAIAALIAAVTWCARLHHGAQPAGHMPAD